jgi:hypothetical protein
VAGSGFGIERDRRQLVLDGSGRGATARKRGISEREFSGDFGAQRFVLQAGGCPRLGGKPAEMFVIVTHFRFLSLVQCWARFKVWRRNEFRQSGRHILA